MLYKLKLVELWLEYICTIFLCNTIRVNYDNNSLSEKHKENKLLLLDLLSAHLTLDLSVGFLFAELVSYHVKCLSQAGHL